MGDRRNRAFHYAVLLSIVVHAVVLLASPSLREAARRIVWPEPIVARLVEAQSPAAPAPPEPPAPAPLIKPPPQQPKPRPEAKAAPQTLPSLAPATPAPAAAEPAPPPPAAPTPAPPSASSAPAPAASPPPAPAASVARPGADIDADTVGRYRMLVIEAAKKAKLYPRAARDNNWEGRTGVRVSFARDGRRSSIVVVRSSGHRILDAEAIETVGRADVPVPAGLKGKEFSFEIEVEFELSARS